MPRKAEIKRAIKILKNSKAAGPDGVPAAALKVDMGSTANILHSLFKKIWDKAEESDKWKEGLLIKLPKSGNLRECEKYKGIHRIHNGAQNHQVEAGQASSFEFYKFASFQAAPGMSFSVRTTDVEFEVAFAILQLYLRALRTFMTVLAD